MTRIAVIEDDLPTSNQLAGWIRSAKSGIVIDQWFTRDEAEAALAREHYDAVVLDIELGRERHAGVALINAINKLRQGGHRVISYQNNSCQRFTDKRYRPECFEKRGQPTTWPAPA